MFGFHLLASVKRTNNTLYFHSFHSYVNSNAPSTLIRFQKDLHPHLLFLYRFRPSTLQRSSREKPHGTVCSLFWILTELMFTPSTLENSVFKKHHFQIAPLWKAFSNDSVYDDRFWHCSVDDDRIRSKTAPLSFENGLVWTGPTIVLILTVTA